MTQDANGWAALQQPAEYGAQEMVKGILAGIGNKHSDILGWRSQDSLINGAGGSVSESRYLTPAERLAWSCKQQQQRASSAGGFGGGSGPGGGGSLHRHNRAMQQHQMVHDSIKSVSTAIMEFCQAEDVPQPPPPLPAAPSIPRRRKEHRAQIVWLESSFISSEAKSKL